MYNLEIKGKDALVKFWAPWCGHCRAMAPAYQRLADAFAGNSEVLIAEINGDDYYEFCDGFGIPGYPSLKFFPRDNTLPSESYRGGRSFEDMKRFMDSKLSQHKMKA